MPIASIAVAKDNGGFQPKEFAAHKNEILEALDFDNELDYVFGLIRGNEFKDQSDNKVPLGDVLNFGKSIKSGEVFTSGLDGFDKDTRKVIDRNINNIKNCLTGEYMVKAYNSKTERYEYFTFKKDSKHFNPLLAVLPLSCDELNNATAFDQNKKKIIDFIRTKGLTDKDTINTFLKASTVKQKLACLNKLKQINASLAQNKYDNEVEAFKSLKLGDDYDEFDFQIIVGGSKECSNLRNTYKGNMEKEGMRQAVEKTLKDYLKQEVSAGYYRQYLSFANSVINATEGDDDDLFFNDLNAQFGDYYQSEEKNTVGLVKRNDEKVLGMAWDKHVLNPEKADVRFSDKPGDSAIYMRNIFKKINSYASDIQAFLSRNSYSKGDSIFNRPVKPMGGSATIVQSDVSNHYSSMVRYLSNSIKKIKSAIDEPEYADSRVQRMVRNWAQSKGLYDMCFTTAGVNNTSISLTYTGAGGGLTDNMTKNDDVYAKFDKKEADYKTMDGFISDITDKAKKNTLLDAVNSPDFTMKTFTENILLQVDRSSDGDSKLASMIKSAWNSAVITTGNNYGEIGSDIYEIKKIIEGENGDKTGAASIFSMRNMLNNRMNDKAHDPINNTPEQEKEVINAFFKNMLEYGIDGQVASGLIAEPETYKDRSYSEYVEYKENADFNSMVAEHNPANAQEKVLLNSKMTKDDVKKVEYFLRQSVYELKNNFVDIWANYDYSMHGQDARIAYLANYNMIGIGARPHAVQYYMQMSDGFSDPASPEYARNILIMDKIFKLAASDDKTESNGILTLFSEIERRLNKTYNLSMASSQKSKNKGLYFDFKNKFLRDAESFGYARGIKNKANVGLKFKNAYINLAQVKGKGEKVQKVKKVPSTTISLTFDPDPGSYQSKLEDLGKLVLKFEHIKCMTLFRDAKLGSLNFRVMIKLVTEGKNEARKIDTYRARMGSFVRLTLQLGPETSFGEKMMYLSEVSTMPDPDDEGKEIGIITFSDFSSMFPFAKVYGCVNGQIDIYSAFSSKLSPMTNERHNLQDSSVIKLTETKDQYVSLNAELKKVIPKEQAINGILNGVSWGDYSAKFFRKYGYKVKSSIVSQPIDKNKFDVDVFVAPITRKSVIEKSRSQSRRGKHLQYPIVESINMAKSIEPNTYFASTFTAGYHFNDLNDEIYNTVISGNKGTAYSFPPEYNASRPKEAELVCKANSALFVDTASNALTGQKDVFHQSVTVNTIRAQYVNHNSSLASQSAREMFRFTFAKSDDKKAGSSSAGLVASLFDLLTSETTYLDKELPLFNCYAIHFDNVVVDNDNSSGIFFKSTASGNSSLFGLRDMKVTDNNRGSVYSTAFQLYDKNDEMGIDNGPSMAEIKASRDHANSVLGNDNASEIDKVAAKNELAQANKDYERTMNTYAWHSVPTDLITYFPSTYKHVGSDKDKVLEIKPNDAKMFRDVFYTRGDNTGKPQFSSANLQVDYHLSFIGDEYCSFDGDVVMKSLTT